MPYFVSPAFCCTNKYFSIIPKPLASFPNVIKLCENLVASHALTADLLLGFQVQQIPTENIHK